MESKKTYTGTFNFNGKELVVEGSNIEELIMEVKPDFLHTEMFIAIQKGKDQMDRHLDLLKGKKLFADETFRGIFINNLMLA